MSSLTEVDSNGNLIVPPENREAFVESKLSENGQDFAFLTAFEGNDEERGLSQRNLCGKLSSLPKYPNVATTSILGSYLAQEVIKGISRSSAPNFNTSVCSGNGQGVSVYPINSTMTAP